MVFDEIISLLTEEGVYFKIHEHGPVISIKDVENSLDFPVNQLIKTLVFKIDTILVLAVVCGKDRINYRKLAKACEINPSLITKANHTEIEVQLGFQLGGICPITRNKAVKVILDHNITKLGIVYCGVGVNNKSLEINVKDLIEITGGIVSNLI